MSSREGLRRDFIEGILIFFLATSFYFGLLWLMRKDHQPKPPEIKVQSLVEVR